MRGAPGALVPRMLGCQANPRHGCPHSGFQDRRIRPLCHLSVFPTYIKHPPFRDISAAECADPLATTSGQPLGHSSAQPKMLPSSPSFFSLDSPSQASRNDHACEADRETWYTIGTFFRRL